MHPLNDVLEQLAAKPLDLGQLLYLMELPALSGFIVSMGAIESIRDKRLWRSKHTSFDNYCRQKFGLSETSINFAISVQNECKKIVN